MAKFRYKTWAGDWKDIDAYRIKFEPGHVVFRDDMNRIILAEANSNVNGLSQLPDED